MADQHLTPAETAARLRVSLPTLARWRGAGDGPKYIKLKGRVLYPHAELVRFEKANTHQSTREVAE